MCIATSAWRVPAVFLSLLAVSLPFYFALVFLLTRFPFRVELAKSIVGLRRS
eukprot:SAG11_NODE_7661_length_1113_cov_2.571006_2_plen_51_part_01